MIFYRKVNILMEDENEFDKPGIRPSGISLSDKTRWRWKNRNSRVLALSNRWNIIIKSSLRLTKGFGCLYP